MFDSDCRASAMTHRFPSIPEGHLLSFGAHRTGSTLQTLERLWSSTIGDTDGCFKKFGSI